MSGSWKTVFGVIKLHAYLRLGAFLVQALVAFKGAGAAV